jgi:hypothetical protein
LPFKSKYRAARDVRAGVDAMEVIAVDCND